jgi:hypothetical protein
MYEKYLHAYEQGYERGFSGGSAYPIPNECPTRGPVLVWFKAGVADGLWDRGQGHPKRHSYEPPARTGE